MSKAWVISDNDFEQSQVVFCETRNQAKHIAACEFGEEYIHVNVRREKKYDQYFKNGVSESVLLDDGWFYWCFECGRQVFRETCPNLVISENGFIYCSPECQKRPRS